MVRRIATLLYLFGLAALVCLAAGCLPVTQKGIRHELGPIYGHFDAQHQETQELKDEVKKLWESLGDVARGQQTIAEWATQTTDRLIQLERAGKITQRDLGLARSAVDKLKKQMVATRTEIAKEHKGLGEKIDTTATAVADIDRKVDATKVEAKEAHEKIDENVSDVRRGIAGVDKAVDEAQKALGEKIDTTATAVADVGRKVDTAATDAKTAHDDHAAEAEKARQEIMRLLGTLSPPPATPPAPAAPAAGTP